MRMMMVDGEGEKKRRAHIGTLEHRRGGVFSFFNIFILLNMAIGPQHRSGVHLSPYFLQPNFSYLSYIYIDLSPLFGRTPGP
jgi:hypothetical protein